MKTCKMSNFLEMFLKFFLLFCFVIEILKNGVVQNVDLSSGSVDWSQVTVKKTTDNKNISTWKMIFSEGLTAGVQLTNGMFQLVIDAGGSYRGKFNGDFLKSYIKIFIYFFSMKFWK